MSIDSEPEIIFKWTNLCRLCLSSESHIDLFSSELDSQECLSKLRSCLNLLVYYGDPMPTKLCSKCHLKLDEWCQFRKQCLQSEANVKRRLQPYKDIQFVKDYFERCAKFESSEIVSSSSKTNTNSVQSFEEANSSDHAQEYLEEENFKKFPKPPHVSDRKGNSKKNKKLSKNSQKAISSNKLKSCEVKLSEKTHNSEGIFDEDSDVSLRQEDLDAIEGKNENSALGTIVSVTGSASDLWDTQYHSKQSEDESYFYGENYSKTDERINGQDRSCPHCGVDLSPEEFDLHTCCVIGSSTHLEEEGEGEGEEGFGEEEQLDEEEEEEDDDEDDDDEDGDINDEENGHFEDSISLESDGTETFLTEDQVPGGGAIRSTVRSKISPWKCKPCNSYFASCLELRKHYSSLKCLGKKAKAIDCEFCYRQFLTLNELLEHQVVHIRINLNLTDDDLICCNQCLLQFPDQRRLKNHLLVHALKRKLPTKYTCSSCSQVFTQKDSYETHLLTHVEMQSPTESSMEPELEAEHEPETTPSDEPMVTEATASTEATSPEEPKKAQGAVRCFRCGQMFGSVKQLEHHETIKHKNPTPYICRKCCLRFSARSQLLMHLRVHMSKSNSKSSPGTEANEHSCTMCDAKFLLESDLDSHMKTHRNPTSEPPSPTTPTQTPTEEDEANSDMFAKYKCSLCSRLYVRAASCIRHGQQSHKGQKVVPLRLKRPVYLGRRTSLAPGGKVKHKCPKCPKYFFSFNAFSIHAYRNHGMKMQNPAEESNNLETEENPESSKTDELESKCPFCSKDIKPSYISLHIKKFHRGEVLDPSLIEKDTADSCICRYCLKTCSTPHNRRLHESIHYPVKAQRNQCETCGQKFVEESEYEDHARTCKSIRCGKCHKIFFKFVNLTQHSCTGTRNDEAHKCTVCLSAFTSLDLLQIHIKNFHGKKSESSSGQAGTSKNSGKRLDRELWREESNKIVCMVGEKFYCTYCDCEFSTTQESNEHRAVHPRGNWYAVQISDSLFQCTICDKFFETRKSSLLHINYHKKNLLPEPAKPVALSLEPEVEIFTDVAPKVKKFNCRFCSAAFRDEEDLQEHLFHTHVQQT